MGVYLAGASIEMSVLASDHILDTANDCNKVVIECSSIQYQWSTLARYLDMSDATINSIDAGTGSLFTKLSSLIAAWLKREKPTHRPSWRVLCKALEDMGNRELAETIGSSSVVPIPLPTKSINVLSVEVSPTASAKDIFQDHSYDITTMIDNPIKFGNELARVNLIPRSMVDDLASQHAFSNHDKTSHLVAAVSRSLTVKDDPQLLLKICEILKQQQVVVLDDIVVTILRKLEGNNDLVKPPSGVLSESSSTSTARDIPQVSKADRIQQFFTGSGKEKLKRPFERNMDQIVEEMCKAEVISQGVRNNPSYDNFMEEFLDTLTFLEDDQLASYCSKFLKVLISIGGPTKHCGEWIKREIEKFGLLITLE